MSSTSNQSDVAALVAENAELKAALTESRALIGEMQAQLAWFNRQLFGRKSEKLQEVDPALQRSLLTGLVDDPPSAPPAETETVERKKRGPKLRDGCVTESGLRFDEITPIRTVDHKPAELLGPDADDYEVVSVQKTHRLGQQQTSYVVIEHRNYVIKHKPSGALISNYAPNAVLERSLADVTLLAGMLVDKFQYHEPLYRLHQRMAEAGIQVSRSLLSQLVAKASLLLKPIYDAQLSRVLTSSTLLMDETPIKAGRNGKGRMKQCYYWPVMGEAGEICFTFANTRARMHIERVLKEQFQGTLVTDGYGAYASYVKQHNRVVHAQCWAHGRRKFEHAQDAHPKAREALVLIAELYKQEAWIREKRLEGPDKHQARAERCKPIVERFWAWCRDQQQDLSLEPSNALAKALKYVLDRRQEMDVFLDDPAVPLDTNALERGLRPIPMGRKAWLFCWTEVGAEHVGVIQSLISTCKLHGVQPYTYLVDVLQRVGEHPAKRVEELTPRRWKELFADQPMTADWGA